MSKAFCSMEMKTVSGFSKYTKHEKLDWIADQFFQKPLQSKQVYQEFWLEDGQQQQVFDGFSENTISNFLLPYGVAPNFLINGKTYAVPMVIEESSVVAAASSAAKYWMSRGGFQAEVRSTVKVGHIHFFWKGEPAKLSAIFSSLKQRLIEISDPLTANMRNRGGGILDIGLRVLNHLEPDYYQLLVKFETCDSMGANFINSVLEAFSDELPAFFKSQDILDAEEKDVEVLMSILSNYTPECLVRVSASCPVESLDCTNVFDGAYFADRFRKAILAAQLDVYRATTHNKGIFNGIDAVVLATGNDFRAIEAAGHAYAARSGQYKSLSNCTVEDGQFRFWMDIPLALGTVGGLTKLHPLAKQSLELLGNPSAQELMMVIAATGLAQNFAAVRSLITTGIQKGHMKMHLKNILNHLSASPEEVSKAETHFEKHMVSFNAVRAFIDGVRNTSLPNA